MVLNKVIYTFLTIHEKSNRRLWVFHKNSILLNAIFATEVRILLSSLTYCLDSTVIELNTTFETIISEELGVKLQFPY